MNAQPSLGRSAGGRRPLLVLYIAAVFLYWFTQYVYVPSLPEYALTRAGSLAAAGVVLSMYGLWMTLARFPFGVLIDAVGRPKAFLLAGFGVGALGDLLMGAAGAAPGLLIGRSLTGISMGAWVPMVVIFSGLFPPEEAVRATALLTFVSSAARVASTAANGLLVGWGGMRLPFWVAALLCLLTIGLLLPIHPVPRPPRRVSLRSVTRLITRRDVLLPSLQSIVLQYVAQGVSLGFLPILARRMGAGDMTISLLVSTNLLAMTTGNLAATGLARRLGAKGLLAVTYLLLLSGTLALVFQTTLPPLFALQAVLGLAQGVGFPVLMGLSIRQVEAGERSTAMGLFQSVYSFGMFLGPWASGLLAQGLGLKAMFGCTAVICLAGGVAGLLGTGQRSAGGGEPPIGRNPPAPI